MTARRLTGRCLCGAVEYAVADAFEYAAMCHCGDCRRATGSANKPFAGIRIGALSLAKGDNATMRYGNGVNHDMHCARCGSLLYSVVRDGEYAHVTMGTLVEEPSIRPKEHIFVASKASWEVIADGLPQYARHSFEGPPINQPVQLAAGMERPAEVVRSLDHIQIAIPQGSEDMARSFYRDLLGFAERPKPQELRGAGGLWLKAGSAELHLGIETPFHPALKAHPCFVVDDMDALRAMLIADGHAARLDDRVPDRRRFFTDDPFGNRLEFVQA